MGRHRIGGTRGLALKIDVVQMSLRGEEARGRFSKLLRKLKMLTMPGIREENESSVGKLLLKDE